MNLDCSNLNKPSDITSQCSYHDTHSGDSRDEVSCCQSKDDNNNYDELERFFNRYFDENIHNKKLFLKAMCECCNEKGQSKWNWDRYIECMKKKRLS